VGLRFEIEVGGITEGFEGADIPRTTVTPAKYPHGSGKNPNAYARPGNQTNEPFRFSRNFIGSDPLWDWRKKIANGIKAGNNDFKKTGHLIQYDHDGRTALAEWDFEGAWITEWNIDPDLDAAGNEILKEQIVLVADVIVQKEGGAEDGAPPAKTLRSPTTSFEWMSRGGASRGSSACPGWTPRPRWSRCERGRARSRPLRIPWCSVRARRPTPI